MAPTYWDRREAAVWALGVASCVAWFGFAMMYGLLGQPMVWVVPVVAYGRWVEEHQQLWPRLHPKLRDTRRDH